MDKKISDFDNASTLNGGDFIPIVSGSNNKKITAGVFSLNMPNIGNKGITKNAVTIPLTQVIPTTSSLISLTDVPTTYSLLAGGDGQEITIVSMGNNTILSTSSYVMSIDMVAGSTVTLVYVLKWAVKSSFNCTIQ
jgi:hypothetical protein